MRSGRRNKTITWAFCSAVHSCDTFKAKKCVLLDSVGFVISNLRGNLCSSEMQAFFKKNTSALVVFLVMGMC